MWRHVSNVLSSFPARWKRAATWRNFLVADYAAAEYTAPQHKKAGGRAVWPGFSCQTLFRRNVMRIASVLLLGLGLGIAYLGTATAQDKAGKEVTLKGTITCAKCALKQEKKCATVIQVKDGDKQALYYFDKASNKKYHGDTCQQAKPGSVTGTVTKDGDKQVIAVSEVKYD